MQYDAAIEAWQTAIKNGMEPRIARTRIGDAYLNLRDYGQAEESYRKAITLGYDKFAYLGIIETHIHKDQKDEAYKILSMLVEREPDDPRVNAAFKRFVER